LRYSILADVLPLHGPYVVVPVLDAVNAFDAAVIQTS